MHFCTDAGSVISVSSCRSGLADAPRTCLFSRLCNPLSLSLSLQDTYSSLSEVLHRTCSSSSTFFLYWQGQGGCPKLDTVLKMWSTKCQAKWYDHFSGGCVACQDSPGRCWRLWLPGTLLAYAHLAAHLDTPVPFLRAVPLPASPHLHRCRGSAFTSAGLSTSH